MKLQEFEGAEKSFFIKVTLFEGETEDFGPYSLRDIKRLYKENRIDGKSFIFHSSMDNWKILADFHDFEEVFGEEAPEIDAINRRVLTRKEIDEQVKVIKPGAVILGHCTDLSMLAIKIFVQNEAAEEFELDEEVELEILGTHFNSAKFKCKVMRLFDSNGDETALTIKFVDLNDHQRNLLSNFIHF
jgi:hypothetical protein